MLAKEYYRLTKPGIIYGNLMTTIAGFFLASTHTIDWGLFVAVCLGVALIIGASCAANNVMDRKIDSKMKRTQNRALVTGLITPKNALLFASVLGGIGLLDLIIFTNYLTVIAGMIGCIDYLYFYGIAKRSTIHSTLIGSVAGATPILAGYLSVTDHLSWVGVSLFAILVIWQMPHFYAIAINHLKQYRSAKLPLLPLKVSIKHTKIQIVCYIVLFVIVSLLPTLLHVCGDIYFGTMLALGLIWLYLASKGFSATSDQKWAKSVFRFSLIVILLFSVLLSFGKRLA
jgi:protoheme IX farnesyltransferase